MNAPILVAPNWENPFILHVDASQFAIGGTLTQEGEAGREMVVAYTSKKLNPTEQNYTANYRELLALATCLQRFRCYLEGATLTVITGNHVVSHFCSKLNLSRREARWLESLGDFNITALQLKPGRINVLGDALSRIRHAKDIRVEQSRMNIVAVAEDDVLRSKLEAYDDDQAFGALFRRFNKEWSSEPKEKRSVELLKPLFQKKDNKVMYKGRACVPRKAVRELIELAHEGRLVGHFKCTNTLGRLSNYHWKHKSRNVRKFCEGCSVCQQQKDHAGEVLNDPTALEIPTRR